LFFYVPAIVVISFLIHLLVFLTNVTFLREFFDSMMLLTLNSIMIQKVFYFDFEALHFVFSGKYSTFKG